MQEGRQIQAGIVRDQPEQVHDGGRVLGRQVMDPAIERRMAHFDGDEQHLVKGEEHRNLDDDGQATGNRVDLFLLVKGHHFLLQAHFVLAEAFLQSLHLRLQQLHLAHGRIRLVGQREHDGLDQHGQRQDRQTHVAQNFVDHLQQIEERLGQEVEPAEINGHVEAFDAELLGIAVQQRQHLGAGEQMIVGFGGRPRLHHLGGTGEVHLEAVVVVDALVDETAGQLGLLVGNQGGQPVFVGKADPAADAFGPFGGQLLQVVILVFDQLAVEDAQGAFVQDVHALGVRRPSARDQRIGMQRHRLGAVVFHPLADLEHVVLVHGDGADETQAFTVVPGQHHRGAGGQLGALRQAPLGVGTGDLGAGVGGHPAEFGVIGMRRTGGRQKFDFLRCRVGGLAVAGQGQIVQLGAGQRQRPMQGRRADADPLGGGERGVAILHRGLGHGGRARRGDIARGRNRRGAGGRLLGGCLDRLGLGRIQPLEPEQDQDREGDGDKQVALFVHDVLSGAWGGTSPPQDLHFGSGTGS